MRGTILLFQPSLGAARLAVLLISGLLLAVQSPSPAHAQLLGGLIGGKTARGDTRDLALSAEELGRARAAQIVFAYVATAPPLDRSAPAGRPASIPEDAQRASAMRTRLATALAAVKRSQEADKDGHAGPASMAELRAAFAPYAGFIAARADRAIARKALPATNVVPAGSVRAFDFPAFCMDSHYAAPKRGETFQLVSASTLLSDELAEIYRAMMMQPGAHTPSYQATIWTFRNAMRDGEPIDISSLSRAQRIEIVRADPQAAARIAKYNREAAGRKLLRGLFNKLLPKAGAFLRRASEMDPRRLATDINRRMTRLEAMRASGAVRRVAAYTVLAPGVVARTISRNGGASGVHIDIANATGRPFRLDPTVLVAQSERKVQRLAIRRPKGFVLHTDGAAHDLLAGLRSAGIDVATIDMLGAASEALLATDIRAKRARRQDTLVANLVLLADAGR